MITRLVTNIDIAKWHQIVAIYIVIIIHVTSYSVASYMHAMPNLSESQCQVDLAITSATKFVITDYLSMAQWTNQLAFPIIVAILASLSVPQEFWK